MRMLLAVLAVCFAVPAYAQQCAPRDDVADILRDRYGERVVGAGIDLSGTLMTIWANTATGSWTITATNPTGITCMVGAGNDYEAVNEPQGVDG